MCARTKSLVAATWLIALFTLCEVAVAEDVYGDDGGYSAFSYGKKGLQYQSLDGNNYLWFGVRLQSRYTISRTVQEMLPGEPVRRESDIKVNRGRLKLGGHLISPAFAVYSEYDFTKDTLLDLRVTYKFAPWLSLRVGQWKSEFNRERIDSSGSQQFAERSVATPWFTIDRQKGIALSGRVGKGKSWDTSYWIGRLSGAGRGGSLSDAEGLWLGRVQWNPGGKLLDFSQSDISRHEPGAASIAIALVSGESRYTKFSSAGGGELPGFPAGEPDQYRIQQILLETAWQKRGFSWQQELHWKTVTDNRNGTKRKLVGGYLQAGMFLSGIRSSVPKPLELAVRYASVDPDEPGGNSVDREVTMVANWFFSGHRNKLTLDLGRFQRRLAPENDTGYRVRLQWDWSF